MRAKILIAKKLKANEWKIGSLAIICEFHDVKEFFVPWNENKL